MLRTEEVIVHGEMLIASQGTANAEADAAPPPPPPPPRPPRPLRCPAKFVSRPNEAAAAAAAAAGVANCAEKEELDSRADGRKGGQTAESCVIHSTQAVVEYVSTSLHYFTLLI